MIAKAYETVRTDRLVYLTGESIPSYLHPCHCDLHQVSFWTDELQLSELLMEDKHKTCCPCCTGEVPIAFLIALEQPKIERIRIERSKNNGIGSL